MRCTRILALLLLFALFGWRSAAAQDIQETPEGMVLNFQNVELPDLVTALAQAAGINVVHSNLPDTDVTLRTAQPVPPESIPALLRQIAEAHNVSIVEDGGFMRLQGPRDEDDAQPPRSLFIYRLEHARATLLANTLRALFGGGAIITGGAGAGPAQTLSQQLQQMGQQAQAALAGQVQAQPQEIVVSEGDGELEGNVQIVPEETSNSLLIRATDADWALIEQAIQALDLRPLQVVIEVVIAEVTRREDLEAGLSINATGDDFAGELPLSENPDAFNVVFDLSTDNVDVEATLAALSATGNVRILSRPVIQAQNNQEARILVGDQRPFVQVSRTLPTDQAARDEIITYRDVATILTILPTINENGYVNLLLTQEVSNATSEREFGAPVISTREATTQLLARSGQTIVIGGLVDQQMEEFRQGIPLLKDIPILGFLFGSTREAVSNSELFLFLTPYVVSDDDDADLLRETIEGNAELLEMLMPIRSILPPVMRELVPDTAGPADVLLPDTVTPPAALPPDTIRRRP